MAHLYAPQGAWTLSMNRTHWMFGQFKINILYLAINHKGMAIPLLWTLLPKKDSGMKKYSVVEVQAGLPIYPDMPHYPAKTCILLIYILKPK